MYSKASHLFHAYSETAFAPLVLGVVERFLRNTRENLLRVGLAELAATAGLFVVLELVFTVFFAGVFTFAAAAFLVVFVFRVFGDCVAMA
jgi:hypothetical protein